MIRRDGRHSNDEAENPVRVTDRRRIYLDPEGAEQVNQRLNNQTSNPRMSKNSRRKQKLPNNRFKKFERASINFVSNFSVRQTKPDND